MNAKEGDDEFPIYFSLQLQGIYLLTHILVMSLISRSAQNSSIQFPKINRFLGTETLVKRRSLDVSAPPFTVLSASFGWKVLHQKWRRQHTPAPGLCGGVAATGPRGGPARTLRGCCCRVTLVADSLRPHGLQHGRPPSPSPSLGVYSDSCPLSW